MRDIEIICKILCSSIQDEELKKACYEWCFNRVKEILEEEILIYR